MEILIRESRWGDRKVLLEIWQRAVRASHNFLTEQEIDYFYSHMRDQYLPHAKMMVAQDGNYAVAFLGLNDSRIETLYVDTSHQGRGYGTALLRQALEKGAKLAEVNEQNAKARSFFRKNGLSEIGRDSRIVNLSEEDQRHFPMVQMRVDI